VSDLIVRCSSIGRLMARPEAADLDPAFVDDEVRAIIAKTKRSEAEKSLLEHARRNSLSAGGKTHVRELVREAVYGFEPTDIETRPILKGHEVEGACIELLSRLTGRPLVKNTERRTNGLITGECDVFDAPLRHGRDVKAPYSMQSMPIVLADCFDSGYEWQMRGYEVLWDADTWSVDYVLVDTPDELIGFEPPSLHYVSHIPERLRWTSWVVKRDRTLESLIVDKVTAARRYYREVMNEFDRTHRVFDDRTTGQAQMAPSNPSFENLRARMMATRSLDEALLILDEAAGLPKEQVGALTDMSIDLY
jgi:hypothetical protein